MLVAILILVVAPLAQATTPQGTLSLGPIWVGFGDVGVGDTREAIVKIANTGKGRVTISRHQLVGGDFSVVGGLYFPLYLEPQRRITITIKFAPKSAGTYTGALTIRSDATNSLVTYLLSGTGTEILVPSSGTAAQLSAKPSAVSLGTTTVGSTNSQTIILTNHGSNAITVTKVTITGSDFQFSNLTAPHVVHAGMSAAFQAEFTPKDVGAHSGSLIIASTAANPSLTIPLDGTATTATRTLSVSPNPLNLGSVAVGSSLTKGVTLTNTGNSSLTVSAMAVSDPGLTVSGGVTGVSIAPTQSATLNVQYSPATDGKLQGSVILKSNAVNSPTTVSITGTAVASSSSTHHVSLTWQASTSPEVVGYYVYRLSSGRSAYARLNASYITSLSFTDNTVVAGDTYSYTVTAVNSSGIESSYSTQAQAIIP